MKKINARRNRSEIEADSPQTVSRFKWLLALKLCTSLALVLIFDAAGIFAAVSNMLMLCLNTVVPSLFAFLALSTFAVSSGLVQSNAAIFVLSLVGGYPVGAKLLSQKAPLERKQAERMLMYCYCGSPAFLLAIAGRFGLYIWLSNALACLIFAVVDRFVITRISVVEPESNPPPRPIVLNTGLFVNSVTSAGITLCKICLMMLVFAVGIRMVEFVGIMQFLPDYAYPIIEITNITNLTAAHPALISALTSFGGLCVLFQTYVITSDSAGVKRLRLKAFLLARLPIAALSAGVCYLLTRNITIETFSHYNHVLVSGERNPLGSVFLLIMVLILIVSCNGEPLNGDSLKR
jgi:hypothetical protein